MRLPDLDAVDFLWLDHQIVGKSHAHHQDQNAKKGPQLFGLQLLTDLRSELRADGPSDHQDQRQYDVDGLGRGGMQGRLPQPS